MIWWFLAGLIIGAGMTFCAIAAWPGGGRWTAIHGLRLCRTRWMEERYACVSCDNQVVYP